ncbi:MAG: hypothetical protein ACOX1P_24585 [Thermoguttaceae bacterium]|jgi:hypothetical protein
MRMCGCLTIVAIVMFGAGAAASAAEPAPAYQHLKSLEKIVGDWRTVYEIDGQETEGELHCKWAPGKYCLTWTAEIRAKDGGKPLSRGSAVIAWDPAEKRVRETSVMSDGTLATAYLSEQDGKLLIDRSGVMADGTRFTTRPVGAFAGDRINFTGNELVADDGKVLRTFKPGFFQRIEKPKRPKR